MGVLLRLIRFFLVLALMGHVIACQEKPPASLVKLTGKTMGTTWLLTLGQESAERLKSVGGSSAASQALESDITAELARINALMSTWDAKSELSLFNAARTTDAMPMHRHTLQVIRAAQSVAAATNGAYDVTRGNVFALWGFSRDKPNPEAPQANEIAAALADSGWRKLTVHPSALQKLSAALSVDLSSLAKGFAVDQLGELLEHRGMTHYLVNIGGEIRTRGRKSTSERWEVGVETPDATASEGLQLQAAHVATSGSYRNVRVVAGQRISHLIDGRTGQPIEHELVAATVLHSSTMLADAWATAYMVIGADAAKRHSLQENLAVQLTVLKKPAAGNSAEDEKSPKFSLWRSPKWEQLQTAEP